MRRLLLALLAACSAQPPLECELPAFLPRERVLTIEMVDASERSPEPGARTLIEIYDATAIADSSDIQVACALFEGVPERVELGAPKLASRAVASHALVRTDLENDGIGGCDLFGLQNGRLAPIPTSTGAHRVEIELDETEECSD